MLRRFIFKKKLQVINVAMNSFECKQNDPRGAGAEETGRVEFFQIFDKRGGKTDRMEFS